MGGFGKRLAGGLIATAEPRLDGNALATLLLYSLRSCESRAFVLQVSGFGAKELTTRGGKGLRQQ